MTDPVFCARALDEMDTDHDGTLSLDELLNFAEQVSR